MISVQIMKLVLELEPEPHYSILTFENLLWIAFPENPLAQNLHFPKLGREG